MSWPVAGSCPSTRPSSAAASSSSRAIAGVSSSGATSSLIVARRGVAGAASSPSAAASVTSPVDACRHDLLDVRPVAADPHDDALADVDRRDGPGVDVAEVLDEVAQPLGRARLVTEVETVQPG